MVSRVITATMLFVQFALYSWYFVGTLKNEIPGAVLELCQLRIKQFSPDILKFSTKLEDNPFTINYLMVPRTCLFIFDAGLRRLGSNNFRNSSYKEKTAGSVRVSRLSFRFLWLWWKFTYAALVNLKRNLFNHLNDCFFPKTKNLMDLFWNDQMQSEKET